jgi:hypothetical protein
VALLDDPSHINIQYPFTLTQVGELLSYPSWNGADKLINKNRKGVNIKSSDNKYHVTIQIGKTEMNKLITFPPSFTGCCVLLKIIYKHILPKGY